MQTKQNYSHYNNATARNYHLFGQVCIQRSQSNIGCMLHHYEIIHSILTGLHIFCGYVTIINQITALTTPIRTSGVECLRPLEGNKLFLDPTPVNNSIQVVEWYLKPGGNVCNSPLGCFPFLRFTPNKRHPKYICRT